MLYICMAGILRVIIPTYGGNPKILNRHRPSPSLQLPELRDWSVTAVCSAPTYGPRGTLRRSAEIDSRRADCAPRRVQRHQQAR